MAAAEGTAGTIGPGRTGPRLGLRSVLFLRERGLAETPDLRGGRTGEVSREGLGEVAEVVVVGTMEVVDALFRMGGVDAGCWRVDVAEARSSFALTPALAFPRSSSTASADLGVADAMTQLGSGTGSGSVVALL